MEKVRLQREIEGPLRMARGEDISSDEEEDETYFEPMVVSRTSNVGRMMGKWLYAVVDDT